MAWGGSGWMASPLAPVPAPCGSPWGREGGSGQNPMAVAALSWLSGSWGHSMASLGPRGGPEAPSICRGNGWVSPANSPLPGVGLAGPDRLSGCPCAGWAAWLLTSLWVAVVTQLPPRKWPGLPQASAWEAPPAQSQLGPIRHPPFVFTWFELGSCDLQPGAP